MSRWFNFDRNPLLALVPLAIAFVVVWEIGHWMRMATGATVAWGVGIVLVGAVAISLLLKRRK